MSSINRPMATAAHPVSVNHEGTPVKVLTPIQELRRSVLSCMLWENEFYESGESIASRISRLVQSISKTNPEGIVAVAVEARSAMKLRHVPLLLARELARSTPKARTLVSGLLANIIQRPDELKEFLAIYWKDKKEPLSAQVKKGLALASLKFNEYSLAKYNRKGAVNLKDVVRLVHPKPNNKEQAALLGRLVKDEMATPDTWEVELSAGKDKNATFTRLIKEDKLGALALLRNLRNMVGSGVDRNLIGNALEKMDVSRVLPFRFITAAKYAPSLEPQLEKAMFKALEGMDKLPGKTALIIDHSGSMNGMVSAKSELTRLDAAAALAILVRELCDDVRIWSFGDNAEEIPARRGFALRDAVLRAKGGGSYGGKAVALANAAGYDRIIVLTDGQWHMIKSTQPANHWSGSMGEAITVSPAPLTYKAYMLNIASYKNGVGYGKWYSIDGYSEAVISYITQLEKL